MTIPTDPGPADAKSKIVEFRRTFERIMAEAGKVMVGYEETIRHVLTAAFVGGNVLLEGVPGIGKTTSSKHWARCSTWRSSASSSRPT